MIASISTHLGDYFAKEATYRRGLAIIPWCNLASAWNTTHQFKIEQPRSNPTKYPWTNPTKFFV